MSRSCKVKPESIQKVKNALRRNGFPSQNALAEDLGMSRPTVNTFLNGKPVDYLNFVEIAKKLGLDWQDIVDIEAEEIEITLQSHHYEDWGKAPDVSKFDGRLKEREELKEWIIQDKCRLVVISAMAGMGKTYLATKLAHDLKDEFEYVIWRSLREIPSLDELLKDLIQCFPDAQILGTEGQDAKLTMLMECLKNHRCLIIFDNLDPLCQDKTACDNYLYLLQQIGEQYHQSCMILTSRQELSELAHLIGDEQPVRSKQLLGLGFEEAQKILHDGKIWGQNEEEEEKLINNYDGNPYLLKLAVSYIKNLKSSNVGEFIKSGIFVFNGVDELLEEYFTQLDENERRILCFLAINRQPISEEELWYDIKTLEISKNALRNILKKLKNYSLIGTRREYKVTLYTLPDFIMEFMTNKIIDKIFNGIQEDSFEILNRYPLIKSSSTEEIRKAQERTILKPLLDRLPGRPQQLQEKFKKLLNLVRTNQFKPGSGYLAANFLNLIVLIKSDLESNSPIKFNSTDLNLSELEIWQADFTKFSLQNVDLINSNLENIRFIYPFGGVLSVSISQNGECLVVGDASHNIYVFKISHYQFNLYSILPGSSHWIRVVTISPDGKLLASAGEEKIIRLWNLETGKVQRLLEGFETDVRCLAFNPNNTILASGSHDCQVIIWDIQTSRRIFTYQVSKQKVRSVVWSKTGKTLLAAAEGGSIYIFSVKPDEVTLLREFSLEPQYSANPDYLLRAIIISSDNRLLITGGDDGVIRFWNINLNEEDPEKIEISFVRGIQGHKDWIRHFSIDPTGKILASASEDRTIRLWNLETGECLSILDGHSSRVWQVTFNEDSRILVSVSDDQTVKFWDTQTGKCRDTLQGQTCKIRSVAFSPDNQTLITGSDDQVARLYNLDGKLLNTFTGHNGRIWSVAFTLDGKNIVTASDDKTIRIWNVRGDYCKTFPQKHQSWIRSLDVSKNYIVSGGDDKTVRVYDLTKNEWIELVREHKDWIKSVAISRDEKWIVSGSDDSTVRIWNVEERLCHGPLKHPNAVRAVDISPDSELIATGCNDNLIRLWDRETQKLLQVLPGHTQWIRAIQFNPDGKLLASGSYDCMVKIWDVETGRCIETLRGHSGAVVSVAFSSDGKLLASGSEDETVIIWDLEKYQQIRTIRNPRPYEGIDITGVTGINEAQKQMLKMLGAVERD